MLEILMLLFLYRYALEHPQQRTYILLGGAAAIALLAAFIGWHCWPTG